MPKPALAPKIASLAVTDDTRARFAWPLAGLLERPVVDEDDVVELLDRLAVVVASEGTDPIVVGTSKTRRKAGAQVVLRLLRGVSVSDEDVAGVLQMAPRDLRPRREHPPDWVTRTDALKVLQRQVDLSQVPVRAQGDLRGVRCAVYDLVRLSPLTYPALNALACAVELVDPATGEINWPVLADVVGYDPRKVFAVADHDRRERGRAQGRYREVLAEWVNVGKLRRTLVDGAKFPHAAVDRAILAEVKRREVRLPPNAERLEAAGFAEPQKLRQMRKLTRAVVGASSELVEHARDQVLDSPIPVLADLAGFDLEAEALADDEDGKVAGELEQARPRPPRARDSVAGVSESTAAKIRKSAAYRQRIEQPVRPATPPRGPKAPPHPAGKPFLPSPGRRRMAEQVLADPKASPDLRDDAAKVLDQTGLVAEQNPKSRARARRGRP